MNKYICYYCEVTFEDTFEYTIPIETILSLEELKSAIQVDYQIVTGLPHYLTKQDQECIELYTLDDWIDTFKVVI